MGRGVLLALLLLPSGGLAQERGRPASTIDATFEARWKKSKLKPAAECGDAVFLRRLSLDVTGTLPRPREIRAFLRSRVRDKRSKKIEEKLASPEAAEYFAHLWVQWLMGHEIDFRDLQRLDFGSLTRWLKKTWEEDVPYNRMVRSLLTATGSVRENPAANFQAKYLAAGDPPASLAAASARLFMGEDIRCAQCHDHPYGELTQDEFWGYTSFFRPLSYRRGVLGENSPVRKPSMLREDLGELFQQPRFLDGRVPEQGEARGPALARLTLSFKGDAAARAIVDRVWKLIFGRSLAPARRSKGRPELLQSLVRDFIENGWSLKDLVRSIVSSRAYQLSSEGSEDAREGYAVGPLKIMNSVQFMRVFNYVVQFDEYYRKLYAKDPRLAPFFQDPDAFWVAQTMAAKEMIFPKGRNPEEVMATGTDRMALKLMNNRDIQLLMVAKFGNIGHKGLFQKTLSRISDPGNRIEELFMLLVNRAPTAKEKSRLLRYLKSSRSVMFQHVFSYSDIFWMLFNSSEFIFVG